MNPADVAPSALPLSRRRVADRAVPAGPLGRESGHAGLLACSVWVWAIAIDKIFLYARTKRAMDRFEQAFWSGSRSRNSTARCRQADAVDGGVLCRAMREWKRSFESQSRSFAGLQMRIEKVMNVSIARESRAAGAAALVLATVGSAGPFVGLFGTVWGIMSSFQSIAASKNTSLAVVAPGHCGSAFCHRNRPDRRNSGDNFLQ
jgi:biopolymer transport protein TolQ